jgi:hypothetical protein
MKYNFKSICEAVCYWLSYQYSIGRERLIHEASLRYPIADAITSSEISVDKIQLEKGHPYFEDKRVDILVCNKNVKSIDLDSIDSIFELKLSKQATGNKLSIEHQRVIDDILRLAYFNLMSKKDAYFLVCGTYQDFKNYFIGDMDKQPKDNNEDIKINEQHGKTYNKKEMELPIKPWKTENSLYREYFDFIYIDPKTTSDPILPKEYDLGIQHENAVDNSILKKEKNFGIKSFQDRYNPKQGLKFKNNLKIKTTCMAITPFETKSNRTHACGIWKIEAE